MKIARRSTPKNLAAIARSDQARPLPQISRPLLSFFSRFTCRYLARNFHSLRLLRTGAPQTCPSLPIVVYLNHSAWWDPLICLLLARHFFPQRKSFAPIEAAALGRYAFFQRLGFFPTENTVAGAGGFLRITDRILAQPDHALWITPEGNFADPRTRPVRFRPGLSHIASRVEAAAFLPLALEYVFWEERLPEVLVNFGTPLVFSRERKLATSATTRLFESALTAVQDDLSAAAQRRHAADWQVLLQGGAGVNVAYDFWRGLKAKWQGEKFSAAHSDL